MKFYELEAVCNRLKQFNTITKIFRVENSIIKIEFDKNNSYFFDLTKGNSYIYKDNSFISTKIFNAPFDKHLQKLFTKSSINKIYTKNDDKVLYIQVSQKQSYKKAIYTLVLEFTGIHTNAIILDQNQIIISALRLVSEFSSYREIKIGNKLKPLPPKKFIPQKKVIEDIDNYLEDLYAKKHQKELENLKKSKIKYLQNKLNKLIQIKNQIKSYDQLMDMANNLHKDATLLLQYIYKIDKIQYELDFVSFYDDMNRLIKISKPKDEIDIQKIINDKFNRSKKLKQKAKNSKIEINSLEEKISFLTKTLNIIKNATSKAQIEILFSNNQTNKKNKKDLKQEFETFYIQNYKVQIGKNKDQNIALIKNAKASDIWMHLQDYPSSHLIISTNKKNIPFDILQECAKLVAKFSAEFGGSYLVDFTPRREIKLQENGIVLYNNYDTIKVHI